MNYQAVRRGLTAGLSAACRMQILRSTDATQLAGDRRQRGSCPVSVKLQRRQRRKRRLQTAL